MFVIRKPAQEPKRIIRVATAEELAIYEKNKIEKTSTENKK